MQTSPAHGQLSKKFSVKRATRSNTQYLGDIVRSPRRYLIGINGKMYRPINVNNSKLHKLIMLKKNKIGNLDENSEVFRLPKESKTSNKPNR
jgi:hypothetical protein